jgi:hypothetical protein
MSDAVKNLNKDSLCIKLFFLFYFAMAVIFHLSLDGVETFKEIADPNVTILLFISVGIEIIFFLLMLIGLFVNPKTYWLTSFEGLILGLVFSCLWMIILCAYFNVYDSSWGMKGITFLVYMFIPAIGSFVCYLFLILIAIIQNLSTKKSN